MSHRVSLAVLPAALSAALLSAALLSAAVLGCSIDDESSAPVAAGGASPTTAPPTNSPGNEGTPIASAGVTPGGSNESESRGLPLAPLDEAAGGGMPAGDAEPAAAAEPVQEALPELPSVRQEHAVVALAGEIYVVGGFTPQVTATVQAYHPTNRSWRSVADAPFPLHHANAAVVGDRLYVAGFYNGASFTLVSGRVLEYDPARDAWSERGLMPEGSERASSCVATLGGSIYLFGGARLGGSVTQASAYDVAADSWTELPPLPEAREHCVAAEIEGTLFIAAGRSGGIGGFRPNTWAYDPVLRTYTERAPIPTPRGGAAGAVLDGKLIVFGGEGNADGQSGVFDTVEAYDPSANSWQAFPPMLEPRHGLAAAALDGSIYLPGGASAQGFGAVGDHTALVF